MCMWERGEREKERERLRSSRTTVTTGKGNTSCNAYAWIMSHTSHDPPPHIHTRAMSHRRVISHVTNKCHVIMYMRLTSLRTHTSTPTPPPSSPAQPPSSSPPSPAHLAEILAHLSNKNFQCMQTYPPTHLPPHLHTHPPTHNPKRLKSGRFVKKTYIYSTSVIHADVPTHPPTHPPTH